jgi:zinc transporter ZupT
MRTAASGVASSDAPRADASDRRPNLLLAVVPLLLLAALLAVIVWVGPTSLVRGEAYPPVERLSFGRVVLDANGIIATVLNDGPDPVHIAQVQVDDAFWTFTADGPLTLNHLGQTRLRIPYPWVEGEAHAIRVLTSTGASFDHEIAVAVATPAMDARALGAYTLMGLYVGVLPVAFGLLWFPFLRRLPARGMDFLLALTVGLLVFLLVDGMHDGLEAAAALPVSFQGVVLFAICVAGAFLMLEAVGGWLAGRRQAGGGWVLALLIAVGIGLHNFGEGLAIGSAFSLGEAALGTLLVVGFTLHNTTEGLAIVAPLARARESVRIGQLVQLGAIGGVPTIAGAWIGGFAYTPLWAVIFLGIGVGAIAQVVYQIGRQTARGTAALRAWTSWPVLGGLTAGVAVMYVTGMLVG